MRRNIIIAGSLLLIIAFLIGTSATTALAATLIVTKTADTADGICNLDCSLREAISAAASGDTIEFAAPLFESPQIITLSENIGFRELYIDKNLTITGRGANLLTVRRLPAATAKFRVININSINYPIISISGMTISGGDVSGTDNFDGVGGGIRSYGGFLTLTNCHITENSANYGGGIYSQNNNDLNVINSTVSKNTATGITAGGAGIQKAGGTMNITNSTISGNVKTNANTYSGGAIHSSATTTITSSTITDNGTGGTSSAGGVLKMSGTVTIRNSIVAANKNNSSVPDVASAPFGGSIASSGYNIIGNRGSLNIFNQTDDTSGVAANPSDPRLNPLGDYGGQTPTHSLRANSGAIDKGNAFGATLDQRGVTRPFDDPNSGGTGADKGAFEFLPMVTNLSDNDSGSLRQLLAAAPFGGIIIFDPDFFGAASRTITLTSAALSVNINRKVTIVGTGAQKLRIQRSSVSGTPNFPIFSFGASSFGGGDVYADVTLSGMTVAGGFNAGSGGGIFNGFSDLKMIDVHVTGSTATFYGGGIYNAGILRINKSTISGNTSTRSFAGGGGIHNSGRLYLINSTISGNVKTGGTQNGGGIWTESLTIIVNSTITDNRADNAGSAGGIMRDRIYDGATAISNSIIAGNRSNATTPDVGTSLNGSFVSGGFNLIGNRGTVTDFNANGDQTGQNSFSEYTETDLTAPSAVLDPKLAPLALGGGSTVPIHQLLIGSPAIDKGNSFGESNDQRNSMRPNDLLNIPNAAGGDGSDIGAFELLLAPTAAEVSISGRVLTTDGRGLRNARVILTDGSGRSRSALTTAFGYYRFDEIQAGETFVISVAAKRYSFAPVVLTALEDLSEINISAQTTLNE